MEEKGIVRREIVRQLYRGLPELEAGIKKHHPLDKKGGTRHVSGQPGDEKEAIILGAVNWGSRGPIASLKKSEDNMKR